MTRLHDQDRHLRELAAAWDHPAAPLALRGTVPPAVWRWLGSLAAGVVIGAVAVNVLTRTSRRIGS